MHQPRTIILRLSNLLIISHPKITATKPNISLSGIHKLLHHKKFNYIDKVILNPYTIFKFKGNKETNLKLFLTLKNFSNKYQLIGEEDLLINNEECVSTGEFNGIGECKCNYIQFYKSLPKITCKLTQPLFSYKDACKRQRVLINLMEYSKEYWISLYRTDPITCHNLGLFLGYNYVYHCNIQPNNLVIAMSLHKEFCS